MAIITISRGSYYHAKSVAEKLAAKLGYCCVSRDDIVDNLEEFHLPEIKMVRNLHDTFSVLDRFPHGKQRFINAIRSAILKKLLPGNVVYHGLVGHHFVENVSHVVKVRIVADTASRVASEMAREHITEEQARYVLKKDDEERRKWGMYLYGIDIYDPETFNMVINIGTISDDDAVKLIEQATKMSGFQETEESRGVLADASLKAQVSDRLFDFPHASITASQGKVLITLKVPQQQQVIINSRIDQMLAGIDSLKSYHIRFEPYF